MGGLPTAPDPERIRHEYFYAASDYYLAGRFAFFTHEPSVCGNLLHHAIELYLKGQLWLSMSREGLQDLGHDLPAIWNRFKAGVNDKQLRVFDRTVAEVHAFEALRYPERILEMGMLFHFELTRADVETARKGDSGDLVSKVPLYLLAIEEVDHLVRKIFDLSGLDPKIFLRGRLSSPARRWYLLRSNSAWKAEDI